MFDHGVGHPLLLLCDTKAPNYRKKKAFEDLDYYSEWPKVADAVIKADHWTSAVESSAPLDFLSLHATWTPFGRLISCKKCQ